MAIEFKLPDLGENIESATIVRMMVKEGDRVEKDQSVVEIETDKAALEVPCDAAGTVSKVHVKDGDEARVGQIILTLDGVAEKKEAPTEGKTEKKEEKPPKEEKREAPPAPKQEKAEEPQAPPRPSGPTVAAAPSVRRLAREIGVEIQDVDGTGPGGRISMDDVKAHARERGGRSTAAAGVAPKLPDFAQWGPIEKKPMSKVRRVTAEHVGAAWSTIPHVHQFDKADATELEALRKRWNEKEGKRQGTKLTATAFLIKLAALALRAYPQFNSSLDAEKNEIIYKGYVHIGVAVDTDRGLLVPVIRDVDRKNVVQISRELDDLAARTREGKLGLEEMRGGCFTISNLGGIGGANFTPIINAPEVAILGVARAAEEVVVQDGEPVIRTMLPLCLAYDHRVIDGADGARFLAGYARMISNPYEMLLV